MKNEVSDPQIIAEWSLACELYKSNGPKLGPIGIALAVGSAAGLFLTNNFWFVLPLVFGMIYLMVDQVAAGTTLMCPRCGKSPLAPMQKGSVLDVEQCHHCGARLVEPS